MDLSPIVTRIADQVVAFQAGDRVFGAAELEAARANPEQLVKPCAFVVWTGDRAIDQASIPGQQARFQEEFAVVVAVDNSVDRRGAAGVATVQSLKAALEDALVGWSPDSSHLPIFYIGSTYVDMTTAVLLHSFNYGTIVPGGSIFTFRLAMRFRLIAGASLSDVYALIYSKVEDLYSGLRLDSDYLADREVVPESGTRYQLRMIPAAVDDRLNTSAALTELAVELEVHHHLSPTDDERTYTEGTMRTNLATLLAPSYWRHPSLIQEVHEPATLSFGANLSRE